MKPTDLHNEIFNHLITRGIRFKPRVHNDARIIMEEKDIDLIQEYEGVTHLYEVKPYKNPAKCIREGLGQLMHYCSQYYDSTENIHLIVAGPVGAN